MKRLGFVFGLMFTLIAGSAMATEEPKFTVTLKEGSFEERHYPAMVVAEVALGGDRNQSVNQGFRVLAGYIFGGNQRRQSIAMTAPVVQAKAQGEQIPMTAPVVQGREGGGWVIRFIMPAGASLATLPTPNDPRVHLKSVPPTRVAVVRFSGLAGEADVERQTAALRKFVAAHHLTPTGPAALARYDPPWTPWFMRRNEIWIPL
jgi:hypothetical protein